MSSILKVNTIQDTDGNNIINESGNVITIGASGDTITVPTSLSMTENLTVNKTTGAELILSRNDTSIAVDDLIGGIQFKANDASSSPDPQICGIKAISTGATNTNPKLSFFAGESNYNANTPNMSIDSGGNITMSSDLTVDTNTLFVDASENTVVIGGTDATSWNSNADELVVAGASAGGMTFYNPTQSNIFFADGTTGDDVSRGRIQYVHSGDSLIFGTDATERMRITSTGLVGIGTSSPTSLLSLEDSSPDIMFTDTSGGTDSKKWRVFGLDSDFRIGCRNDANSSGQTAIQISRSGATITDQRFSTGGSERARIDSGGQFRINNTSSTGHGSIYNLIVGNESSGGDAGVLVVTPNNENAYYGFGDSGGVPCSLNYNHNSNFLRTYVNGSEAMRINSNRDILFNTTDTNPTGNNVKGFVFERDNEAKFSEDGLVLDLNRIGSDGGIVHFRHDGTHVGSIGVTASGASISLGGTATANELNDYEEGTWTPSYAGSTTGSISYGSRGGTYTKVGNLVTAWFSLVNFTTTGSWAGDVKVTGLPFTCNQTNNVRVCTGNCRFYNINTPSNTRFQVSMDVDVSNSHLIFLQSGDDTNWESWQVETTSSSYLEGTITYRTDS